MLDYRSSGGWRNFVQSETQNRVQLALKEGG